MGVRIKVWNGNRAMGIGMNFHCSVSQYHKRICSVIRELAKRSHFDFTLARPSPEHVINLSRTLDMLCSEWLCVLILTKTIHCFFSVHYYKTFWNSSCFSGNGREWELLVRNKWELDYSLRFPKAGNGNEVMRMGTQKSFRTSLLCTWIISTTLSGFQVRKLQYAYQLMICCWQKM